MDAATYHRTRKHGESTVSDFWKILTLFFLGAIFVAVMTHASGFSKAAGTVFTGVNSMGQTLEAGSIKAGQLCPAEATAIPILANTSTLVIPLR